MNQELLREYFDYDPNTGILVWKKRSSNSVVGREAGSINNVGYRSVGFQGKDFLIHRIIWMIVYGEEPKGDIDHINGNRLDNRILNLRCVSHRENQRNLACHRAGKLSGVSYNPKVNRWMARTQIGNRKIFLGEYPTAEEAHEVYLRECKHLEGGVAV